MKLRWVKSEGTNKYGGRYHLQYREHECLDWQDVPTSDEDDKLSDIAREAIDIWQPGYSPLAQPDIEALLDQVKTTFKKYMDKQNKHK